MGLPLWLQRCLRCQGGAGGPPRGGRGGRKHQNGHPAQNTCDGAAAGTPCLLAAPSWCSKGTGNRAIQAT
eukprot:300073-Chlamydomonas_euryale.AAC.1